MKVLDLQCEQGHVFEGWFAGEDDFQQQQARALVACPMCRNTQIAKRLSAPRLNLRSATAPVSAQSAPAARQEADTPQATLQRLWLQAVRHVLASTEDTGRKFPELARQMHYGELPERAIRGQATPAEAEALLEEGIDVLPLLLPDGLNTPLH